MVLVLVSKDLKKISLLAYGVPLQFWQKGLGCCVRSSFLLHPARCLLI